MKKLFYITILLIYGVFSGCQNEEYSNPEIDPREAGVVKFIFTLPNSKILSRGVPAQPGENTINDLILFFFECTKDGSGSYSGYHEVPLEDIPEENQLQGENNNEFTLDIQLNNLNKSNLYNVLIIANIRINVIDNTDESFSQFISQINNMSEKEVIQYTRMHIVGTGNNPEDQYDNDEMVSGSNLLMTGMTTKEANSDVVNCDFERVMCRFDVINKAPDHRLVSVSIWNAYQTAYAWESANVEYNGARTGRYYGLLDEENGFESIYGGLYAFENVVVNPDYLDDKTTCLIVGIQPETSSKGQDISYYRVNIHSKDRGQYLKRNNVYQLTISGVKDIGETTEYLAYKQGEQLLNYSINSWDRDGDGLIIRDGKNLLAIPTSRAVFGIEAEERQYHVYTLGTGTLELNYIDMPSGIEAWLGGKGNELFISVTSFPYEKRVGKFELSFAGMKGIIEVYQSGEKELFLTLDHTDLPQWPAGEVTGLPTESKIRVSSSGPWTAEIYNGNFSFTENVETKFKYGDNNDFIDEIYSLQANDNVNSIYSFILISLDADPENYRNVLVLTQAGKGGFTLSPNVSSVVFNPDGELAAGSNNYDFFTVEPGDPEDTWKAEIIPIERTTEHFSIVYPSENQMVNDLVKGKGSFTIKTRGPNLATTTQAIVRIIHNNLNTKEILVTQGDFNFRLSHEEINGLKAWGDTTVAISITSNFTGGKWSATIESNLDESLGLVPILLDHNGLEVSSITAAGLNETFKVVMPGIDKHITTTPVATIKVKLEDTDLVQELIVRQNDVDYVPIHMQTWRAEFYGSFWSYINYFKQWGVEMVSPENFSENGKVYTKGIIYGEKKSHFAVGWNHIISFDIGNGKSIGPRILNLNNPLPGYGLKVDFAKLRNDQNFVFLLSGHTADATSLSLPGFSEYSYRGIAPSTVKEFTINQNAATINTALWDYIFNGPFGKVIPENVSLAGDATFGCVTQWPETFVPLILNPNNQNQVLFGIDPKRRIIWIGELEIFGTTRNRFTSSYPDNLTFLRNVLAWMVSVNNYGDGFLRHFID